MAFVAAHLKRFPPVTPERARHSGEVQQNSGVLFCARRKGRARVWASVCGRYWLLTLSLSLVPSLFLSPIKRIQRVMRPGLWQCGCSMVQGAPWGPACGRWDRAARSLSPVQINRVKTALVLMERETHIITVNISVIFLPKQTFMTDGREIAVQADEDRLREFLWELSEPLQRYVSIYSAGYMRHKGVIKTSLRFTVRAYMACHSW